MDRKEVEALLAAFVAGFKRPFRMAASWVPSLIMGVVMGCGIVLSTVGAVALSAAHAIGPERSAACLLAATQPEGA